MFVTAVTNAHGSYTFGGLRAGTYTITESQPLGWLDGSDSVGSLGGELGADLFSNIQLKAGQFGMAYDFGEVLVMG